ncbi:DUF3293 domain-containing protein [Mycobacterium sp. M1]|uniref:DUF3293 domain-containing protein n=1 Tax=Mycolicibacter acidiphilus TaxID=2835306 RepID=A0ABS5RPJ2_9MYCO|nr:DUF3293 domain-containing protein [Mycolicibacter acidiphilus]MBS9535478.1 DUF3293 domain-containing protein [Mycolicibacter acidiphilus]
MREFTDFEWASDAVLAGLAAEPFPWEHYLNTKVEFDGYGTLHPLEVDEIGDQEPRLESLHVITAVQPDGDPNSPDSQARLAVLDHHLREHRLESLRAVGVALDDTHREESRAVFGLDDDDARDLGRKFGQVAIFAWAGPHWTLLACASNRQTRRGWRWESH